MSYNTSTQVSHADRAIAGFLVAGIMFVTGYILVRANLARSAPQDPSALTSVVPHEATLWSDGLGR
ncbi:MAG: hypothetical protein F6K19_20345 [Cyanothece sp. SIO1E1]|nr:hypothetical protein [Cyanothece sp. SIO1E1]